MNPIATMAATESKLVAAIDATADALDNVGTKKLDQAMARLNASAEAAKARIASAKAELYATISAVLGEMEEFTADIVNAISANVVEPKALPAPAPTASTSQPVTNSDDEIIDLGAVAPPETNDETATILLPITSDEFASASGPVVSIAANEPAGTTTTPPHTSKRRKGKH